MEKGLVSIITPSYNCARFIAETIRSVQAQSYRDWEMIIVDDCSSDDTEVVVKPYMDADPKIRYHRLKANSGAAVARNLGLELARGEYVAFLDSDDLWTPDKLESQIRFMEDNGYHFSYTRYGLIDENSRPMGVEVSGPKQISHLKMLSFCWPGCLTVMYRVPAVGKLKIVPIAKNNDYAMWLKVSEKVKCHLLDRNLALYRKREGSISNHSYVSLIKWHYRLFRECEKRGRIASAGLTLLNLVCGTFKKLVYNGRYEPQN